MPELMKQSVLDEIYQQLLRRSNDLGLAEIDLSISDPQQGFTL